MMLNRMTDAQIGLAVDAYYDRMLDEFLEDDGSCCANCRFYDKATGTCSKKDDEITEEEYEAMTKEEYELSISVEADDYCDDYDYDDSNEPDPDERYEMMRDEW